MPSITVSAVSTGSDTLTATGHGLVTGDRFRLRNINGALPAATPSLAAVTDYFAVRVDNNTLKIATSSANALAGTPVVVDLTGTGSGTTFVEHSLPYCIPTALAAAGTQIKSDNDNGVWNALAALWARLTGQTQTIWPADFAHGDRTDIILGADFKSTTNTNVTYNTSGFAITGASVTLEARLPLRGGDQLKSVTLVFTGDGSVDITSMDVRLISTGGSASSIGSSSQNDITTLTRTIDVTDTIIGAGTSNAAILVAIAANASGLNVLNCQYTYDRPAPA